MAENSKEMTLNFFTDLNHGDKGGIVRPIGCSRKGSAKQTGSQASRGLGSSVASL